MAQLVEAGKLAWQPPVQEWLPEFTGPGKEEVKIWHLLTHTTGLRAADRVDHRLPWDEAIKKILSVELDHGWMPGKMAAYQPYATWFLLGEIVQRITGEGLPNYVRKQILLPAGMRNTALAWSQAQFEAYTAETANLFHKTHNGWEPHPVFAAPESWLLCRPGSSVRGPIEELCRFYQHLLEVLNGRADGILNPTTLQEMLRPWRTGLQDATFLFPLDWGLGFILNLNHQGSTRAPYSYGVHASARTFGHSGMQSSCGFADPEHGLAVAWVISGMIGERLHSQRARDLNSLIYRSLGLAAS
jgi:CubicO group peptidase (beta-lactamase class C family)